MKFTVDRSQAEVRSFAGPGEYTVIIASAKDEGLDKSGNPVVSLRYKAPTGEALNDRFILKDTMMWRLQALIHATEADIKDGQEFDFSVPGAFLAFVQGFVGLSLNIVLESDNYTDKNGQQATALRVRRMKRVPIDDTI